MMKCNVEMENEINSGKKHAVYIYIMKREREKEQKKDRKIAWQSLVIIISELDLVINNSK